MQITIKTSARTQMIDITSRIQQVVSDSGITGGLAHIFSMHTTGAVTINENADPCVESDILNTVNQMVPWDNKYTHIEGNSAAHIKTSLVGASEMVAIEHGQLVLGTWQGIYFCEFDGPRHRKVNISIIPSG